MMKLRDRSSKTIEKAFTDCGIKNCIVVSDADPDEHIQHWRKESLLVERTFMEDYVFGIVYIPKRKTVNLDTILELEDRLKCTVCFKQKEMRTETIDSETNDFKRINVLVAVLSES